MPIKEDHAYQVTQRFLSAVDRILGDRTSGKTTQQKLGEIIGISSSNINRLRTDPDRKVTLEACCRICDQYKISTSWLLLGTGDMNGNDQPPNEQKKLETKVSDLEKKMKAVSKTLETIQKNIKRR